MPFHRFKMKTEKTHIGYMTDTELKAIEAIQLTAGSNMDDMYVFAAYAGGIRISDIILMHWKNFDREKINMQVKKIVGVISVKVPKAGLVILEKYKPREPIDGSFIFPVLNNGVDYSDPKFLHQTLSSSATYANKDLKKIAEAAKVNKRLHFHTSKHTFGTSALRKGMRLEYASKLMGHSDLRNTQIYAKIVNEELDKAMNVFNKI